MRFVGLSSCCRMKIGFAVALLILPNTAVAAKLQLPAKMAASLGVSLMFARALVVVVGPAGPETAAAGVG